MNLQSDPRQCPYVGLEPFDAAHADYFFGRNLDSAVLADHVHARTVNVLYGASGIGKSSLLNVGLPKALAGGSPWTIIRLSNWQDPRSLERIAVNAIGEALPPDLPKREIGFVRYVTWAIRRTKRPLLLILDQFEEYFLYRDREREALRTIEIAVGRLVARRHLDLHLLISIREDGLHHLDKLRVYIPRILESTIQLTRLDERGVTEAIRGPLKRYNETYRGADKIGLEERLVFALIRQLKEPDNMPSPSDLALGQGQLIELPYLQLMLTKLWGAAGGQYATDLTENMLVELGGVRRIVEDHVNAVMTHLTDREQELCAKIFDRMVTSIGSKIAYPTDALATTEVVGPNVSPSQIDALLSKLTPKEARILKHVVIEGLPGFEIFHDVLAPSVLAWKRNWELKYGGQRPLEPSTVRFRIKDHPDVIIGYKTGGIDAIEDVKVWVNPENTDMMMDRFIGRSVSARIRYLGADKENDSILEDTIQDALRSALGDRSRVRVGTVLVTESGMLLDTNHVERIFHVAIIEVGPDSGANFDLGTVRACVVRVLRRVEMENLRLIRLVTRKHLDSILFPLIGSGDAGLPIESVTETIVTTAVNHFLNNPRPILKEIYFLAFRSRDKRALDAVLQEFCVKGTLIPLDDTADDQGFVASEIGNTVAVLLYSPDDNVVVLVTRVEGRRIGDLIEGSIAKDETPEAAAVRVTMKRTGYGIQRPLLIRDFLSTAGATPERNFLYYGQVDETNRVGGDQGPDDRADSMMKISSIELFDRLDRKQIESEKLTSAAYWLRDHLSPTKPLESATAEFKIKERPELIVGYKTGNLEEVSGVSIWVNSENTDMLMDRFTGKSVSARIRYLGANKDENTVIEDTIQEALKSLIGDEGKVKIGTVLVTEPGMLSATHKVELIFHVATSERGSDADAMSNLVTVRTCLNRVLKRIDVENSKIRRVILKKELESVIFPLFGGGDDSVPIEAVAENMVSAAIDYFRSVSHPVLKKVYFLASKPRDSSAFRRAFQTFYDQGLLIEAR